MRGMKRWAALIWLAFFVMGCTHLDFDMDSDEPEWGEQHQRRTASLARLRTVRLAEALSAWQAEHAFEAVDYRLGPGDVLEIDIFALERPGATASLPRTVAQDGSITLPWVGTIPVAGLTVSQSEDRIEAAYWGTFLREPQVAVNVTDYRSAPVVVTGAVNKPGVFYLERSTGTVLEMLARAGGLSKSAGDELLIVRAKDGARAGTPTHGGDESIGIDLEQLVEQGNLLLNLPVRGGDIITVPPCDTQYVYLLGYVRRPGAYEMEPGRRLDAVRAVALGGGLAGIARARESFLIRQSASGQKAIPVDLVKLARCELPPLYLEPGDMLVVGTTAMGRVFEVLAPSMGASISASASVAP
ncbi:MAG: polysaccharide biosynthesis/export family protein [Candidatus Brocadiae bacterium]|nr:polysaccharide biosynthesis/export family protein [Candidatus Brocadiia bacterium]